MDYTELIGAHVDQRADITIAAQPVNPGTATQMGIFRFDRDGSIVAFEEKPKPDRLEEIGRSIPPGATFARHTDEQPFMASMGIYVFSRDILLDMLERESGHDFGRELIPGALTKYKVKPYLYRGYWADVGTIESFYEANIMLGRAAAPFRFWDPRHPIYTHLRHLPGSRLTNCHVRDSIVTDRIFPGPLRHHRERRRHPARISGRGQGCCAPCFSAELYETAQAPTAMPPARHRA